MAGEAAHLRRLLFCLVHLAILFLAGCWEFTAFLDAKSDLGPDGRVMLGRRFAVTQESVKLPIPQVHQGFPIVFAPNGLDSVVTLPRGSVIHTDYVQETETQMGFGISLVWAGSKRELQGVVTTDPHRLTRVGIWYGIEGIPAVGTSGHLCPLPDDHPAWLDTSALPPKVRNISTTELATAARDPDWVSRYYALRELAHRAPNDKEAIAPLGAALNEDMRMLRAIALKGLTDAGPVPVQYSDGLIARLPAA